MKKIYTVYISTKLASKECTYFTGASITIGINKDTKYRQKIEESSFTCGMLLSAVKSGNPRSKLYVVKHSWVGRAIVRRLRPITR